MKIAMTVCMFLFFGVPVFSQDVHFLTTKPDSREVVASQSHPICSVNMPHEGRSLWAVYSCGHATPEINHFEARHTVLVYGYTPAHRTADVKWWVLAAASTGMGVLDEELTQRNLRLGMGREGNPLLGRTRGQAYAVIGGTELIAILSTLHRKQATTINRELGIAPSQGFWNRIPWWEPFVGLIGAHAVGAASNIH